MKRRTLSNSPTEVDGIDPHSLEAVLAAVEIGRPNRPGVLTPDLERQARKGVPEVILAEGKLMEQTVAAARTFVERAGRAIVSRATPGLQARLQAELAEFDVAVFETARMVVARRRGQRTVSTGGRVGVISAGTSDVPVAEEAVVVAAEMGCQVEVAYDVGVAGLHRLSEPLRRLGQTRVDAVVVAAGMDGALPSVVAGLLDVPVIGLPTSVGYGAGGRGVAALLAMLQCCAPGLVVVNIDNGVGAGATAALIANRMAAARRAAPAEG